MSLSNSCYNRIINIANNLCTSQRLIFVGVYYIMALVGHISGSTQSNSVIGMSGSIIVANRPAALFPAMPATDISFFVSGSKDGTSRSLFGGDLLASSSFNLKSGTGGISQFSVDSTGMLISTVIGAPTVTIAASSGNVTLLGDIAVNGGDITTTSASATLFNSNATAISIGSAGTSITIGSAGGTGTTTVNNNLAVTKNVTVTGDLTVNGAMTTVNTTNLEVKDSVIGFGFASGTLQQAAGDRGWIGGLAGTNNVMSKWDNTAAEFAFATTTSSATGSFAITAYSNLHAANIMGSIVSASLGFSGSLTRLMDGTSYIIGGAGITVASASNGAITLSAAGGGGDVTGPGSSTANAVALFDGATGKIIKNSGLTTDGSNSLFIGGTLGVSGSTTFGASVLPSADSSFDLGSPSFRWANVYTGDLHLRNDRGDYTLIEEENFLTVRFNKTGKRYKFLLESTPEFDEDPTLNF